MRPLLRSLLFGSTLLAALFGPAPFPSEFERASAFSSHDEHSAHAGPALRSGSVATEVAAPPDLAVVSSRAPVSVDDRSPTALVPSVVRTPSPTSEGAAGAARAAARNAEGAALRGTLTTPHAAAGAYAGAPLAASVPGAAPPGVLSPAPPPTGVVHEGPHLVSFARTGNRFLPSDAPRELVLTFDDGPDLRTTPIVLEELDRRGLKGLFFVTGWRLAGDTPEDEARRDLLRKILAHGHMIGNHTFHHANLCKNPELAAREIDSNTAIIASVTGVVPKLFRSPYGAHCHSLDVVLAARGLIDVGWNIDPQDWLHHDSATVTSMLVARLAHFEGRAILLLHDTHVGSVFSLGPVLDELGRQNERAVREGRAPVMVRDYRVFLPPNDEAPLGILALASSLGQDLLAPLVRRP